MTLVLVRHAEPAVSPREDPRLWPLSPIGREAASQLHDRLPRTSRWISSTERNAYETLFYAGHSGIAVAQDRRFDEVRRDEPFDSDSNTRRRAWVQGRLDEGHAGWESPQEAAERVELAVREYAADAGALVVATHGMVLTAWLVHGRQRLARASTAAASASIAGLASRPAARHPRQLGRRAQRSRAERSAAPRCRRPSRRYRAGRLPPVT